MRLLATAVLALALAAPAWAGNPTAADLESELVCPVCKTTLDQSDAPVARRMKAIIRQRLAEGASAAQIKAELADQFGDGVLAAPPKRGFDLLAWALPLGGVALGALALSYLAVVWSRRSPGPAPPGVAIDPELERRLDAELRRLDE
ncbi:MAG: cytochrome c-type biogenesis protein [Gaiellales bacterium]